MKNVFELGSPDMIIIPGTKSTISDLKWMRQNGLEVLVKKAAERGTPILGVCGGYQMLGRTLSREGSMLTAEEVLNAAEPGNILQGSVLATLQSKLLGGAIGVLFGYGGREELEGCAADHIAATVAELESLLLD